MSIYTIKLIQEDNDIKPVIKKENIVIKTKHNGFKMMDDAMWDNSQMIFIFPDSEKAEYFCKNYTSSMANYKEGMIKKDYIFHIIHCKFPEPKEIYVNQMRMRLDFSL